MLGEVLKRRRLVVFGSLLAGGTILLAMGCALGTLGRLTLSDIRSVPHSGVKASLRMGHHGKRGVDCIHCHAGAKKEDRAGIADRKFCMICHEEVDQAKEKFVPGGPFFDKEGRPKWKVVTALPAGVIFSHVKHTKTRDCAECHGDIAHDKYGLVDLAVKYDNCRRCHRAEESFGDCARCHSALEKSRRPHSHDSRWRRYHGGQVRDMGGLDSVDEACNSCHSTSYCVNCHKQEEPRDHTVFFARAGHGLAADIDRERCAACHMQDRCVRCHLAGAAPRPVGHPAVNCGTCHTGLRRHVVLTDNCMLCHR